jgi:D-alanyl-D-alanine carboxypeptidase
MKDDIAGAVAAAAAGADATAAPPPDGTLEAQAVALATPDAGSVTELMASNVTVKASAPTQPLQLAAAATVAPPKRNAPIYTDSTAQMAEVAPQPEVVTRISTSGGEHWGVNLGHFNTRSEAERLLLKIQLVESATLGDGLRKVVPRAGGYDANFVGLGRDDADLACRRLQARAVQCFTMGPG